MQPSPAIIRFGYLKAFSLPKNLQSNWELYFMVQNGHTFLSYMFVDNVPPLVFPCKQASRLLQTWSIWLAPYSLVHWNQQQGVHIPVNWTEIIDLTWWERRVFTSTYNDPLKNSNSLPLHVLPPLSTLALLKWPVKTPSSPHLRLVECWLNYIFNASAWPLPSHTAASVSEELISREKL